MHSPFTRGLALNPEILVSAILALGAHLRCPREGQTLAWKNLRDEQHRYLCDLLEAVGLTAPAGCTVSDMQLLLSAVRDAETVYTPDGPRLVPAMRRDRKVG